MPTVAEALLNQVPPLGAALRPGIEAISANQTITFTKYQRVVLPLDGFIFWVKASLLAPGAVPNGLSLNATTSAANTAPKVVSAAPTVVATGSLHYDSRTTQDETGTYAINRVMFTSEIHVQDLDQVGPETLYIGTIDEIRFSFSSHKNLYKQAQIWHYVGDAIYPELESQIIDNAWDLDTRSIVVSNSLPLWLFFNGYQ